MKNEFNHDAAQKYVLYGGLILVCALFISLGMGANMFYPGEATGHPLFEKSYHALTILVGIVLFCFLVSHKAIRSSHCLLFGTSFVSLNIALPSVAFFLSGIEVMYLVSALLRPVTAICILIFVVWALWLYETSGWETSIGHIEKK